MASDRRGGEGGIDIWRATRSSVDAPWGAPVNLGAPVNSSANDFCPTPLEDGRLFFVSTRVGGCGGADIYVASPDSAGGWAPPEHLGCKVNSAGAEFSPSLFKEGANTILYFSSDRPGGFAAEAEGATSDADIYYSRVQPDGSYGLAVLVAGVNTASDDARPNVRLDGLEIVFDSTRSGGEGGPDVWLASRKTTNYGWSAPVNLGPQINSAAGESRASLSRTGERLYFGSSRLGGEGGSDIYVAVRDGSAATQAPADVLVTPPNTGDGGLREESGTPAWWTVGLVGVSAGATVLLVRRRGRVLP
jgi:Tol biopolymer transport system component